MTMNLGVVGQQVDQLLSPRSRNRSPEKWIRLLTTVITTTEAATPHNVSLWRKVSLRRLAARLRARISPISSICRFAGVFSTIFDNKSSISVCSISFFLLILFNAH